jgi:hypothetical protein
MSNGEEGWSGQGRRGEERVGNECNVVKKESE